MLIANGPCREVAAAFGACYMLRSETYFAEVAAERRVQLVRTIVDTALRHQHQVSPGCALIDIGLLDYNDFLCLHSAPAHDVALFAWLFSFQESLQCSSMVTNKCWGMCDHSACRLSKQASKQAADQLIHASCSWSWGWRHAHVLHLLQHSIFISECLFEKPLQRGRDLAGAQGGSGDSSCDATPRANKGCLFGASADAGESQECSFAHAGRPFQPFVVAIYSASLQPPVSCCSSSYNIHVQVGQLLERQPYQAVTVIKALVPLSWLIQLKPAGVAKHIGSFFRPLYTLLLLQGKVRVGCMQVYPGCLFETDLN